MCRICALVVDLVLSPSLGIRWCKKKCKTWANLCVWSFPSSVLSVFSCHWTVKLELVFRSLCVVASEELRNFSYQTAFLFWASENFAWQWALHNHVLCGKDVGGFALSVGTPWLFCWKTEGNIAISAPYLWLLTMEGFSGEEHFFHGAFSLLELSWNPGDVYHHGSYAV